ncbi:MAG: hypothetical protein DRH37_09335, partial [Deltaproteobacteria bacterium]
MERGPRPGYQKVLPLPSLTWKYVRAFSVTRNADTLRTGNGQRQASSVRTLLKRHGREIRNRRKDPGKDLISRIPKKLQSL